MATSVDLADADSYKLLLLAVLLLVLVPLLVTTYNRSAQGPSISNPPLPPWTEKERLQLDAVPGPAELHSKHVFTHGPVTEHWNLLKLHREYGPVVRIGPQHVSVADAESTKRIYHQATPFLKTEWYNLFTEPGKGVIFNIQTKQFHSKRRQLVSASFSLSSSRQMLPFIRKKALLAMDQIGTKASKGEPTELSTLMKRFAGDVSLNLSLGKDEGQVEGDFSSQLVNDLVARGSADIPTRALASRLERFGPLSAVVMLLTRPTEAQLSVAQRIVRANTTVRTSVADFYARLRKGDVDEGDLLAKIVSAKDPATGETMDFNVVCMEARGFILAASDTTANTLTMAIHHIASTPGVWDKLHAELREAIPSRQHFEEDLTDTTNYYSDLPFLTACIKETYRLSPAIPKLLPRYVPPGGATLADVFLPAGTIVGSSIFVHHRWQEDLWGPAQYADEFHPERWLDTDADKLKQMNSLLSPFSSGSRACLGRHIAELEVHVLLATLFRFYKPRQVLTEMDAMTPVGFFIAGPRGGELKVVLEPTEA